MRTYFLLVVVCALPLFFSACGNTKQTDQQALTDHAPAVETETAGSTNVAVSARLAELGLTTNSEWRGINLGDAFGKVKATEKGESFERDAEHVGYTVDIKNIQTMDILYYQTGGKVSAIDVDLFLNSRQSVTDYQTDLVAYFTSLYGNVTANDGSAVWAGAKRIRVTLTDVSKGKDFGLKIKMAPANAM